MIQINNLIERFPQLEFKRHVVLSVVTLLCVIFVGYFAYEKQKSSLAIAKTELQSMQSEFKNRNATVQLNNLNRDENFNPKRNFKELLSSSSKSDEVVREMSRLAASKGIGLRSLKIVPAAATPSELGKVQYNLTMKTDYYLFKEWLGGLLSRYPALGVNTLAIREIDSNRQDISLSLLLYVKD